GRLPRLPWLLHAALLRFPAGQGDRIRPHAGAGPGSDAHRAFGNGRGRYQDQHPVAPGAPHRRRIHPRRYVDPLPRATVESAQEIRLNTAMAWLVLQLEVQAAAAESWSDALLAAGAIAVDIADARAGTPEEAPLFAEPGEHFASAWPSSRLTALFPLERDLPALMNELGGSALEYRIHA